MYEHSKVGLTLLEHQYTQCGELIDGIPQVIPADGWYWIQVGRSYQVQWVMGCVSGDTVLLLDAVYLWDEVEFHQRHRIGPAVQYPKRDTAADMIAATAMTFMVTHPDPLAEVEEGVDEDDEDTVLEDLTTLEDTTDDAL